MALSAQKRKRLSLATIFFTFFVDNLGWSIVFPILAPLFLDPHQHFFPSEISIATRTTILGFFLAAFPLAQFFGAPVLGEIADRSGRKIALVLTVFLTMIGYALSAWSIQEKHLVVLFISRIITGLFSGNLSICLAAATDLSSDDDEKFKIFGYLSVIAGFSFIIGAFIGGKFSDPTVDPFFHPAFPLWIAALLTLLNFLFVLFAFRETREIPPESKFDFFQGIHNIQKALKTEKIKTIYLIYFLFVFGWTILFQFTPVLVIRKFQFTNSEIGDVAAFMGVCWAIGSGYLNKILLRGFKSLKILEFCLLSFTVLCGLVVFPTNVVGVLIVLGLCVIIAGIAWPLYTAVISSLSPPDIQGKILGMSQSMLSLAMAVSPIIGGLADHFHFGLPFIIAACSNLIAGLIYFQLKLVI